MLQTACRVCINRMGDKAFLNDAAVVGGLCDWSEHSLQSVTTVKTNGRCEAGAKTRRLDPYQGNDATRGTPKRPRRLFAFLARLFFSLMNGRQISCADAP